MNYLRFSLHDNDTYAFREYPQLTANQRIHQSILPDLSGNSRLGIQRCVACGEILNKWEAPLDGIVIKKKKYDIGSTYDGVTIVSQRFKIICAGADLTGLEFRTLPDDPSFFAIRAVRTVAFDAERRKTRFINLCTTCNRYESIVGATPVYLKPGSYIGLNEFVNTDIEFASNDEKSPLLLCGELVAETLKSSKLKGLDLSVCKDIVANIAQS